IKDSLNCFLFVRNNPIVFVDRNGKQTTPKKEAQIGEMKDYNKAGQVPAMRDKQGKRISHYEHIRARINVWLQTHDPETGNSAYTPGDYRKSTTLTIPEDMAKKKDILDMKLRDALKKAQKADMITPQLEAEMTVEADIQRSIVARNQAIAERLANNDPRGI